MLLQTNVAPNGFCAKLKPENTHKDWIHAAATENSSLSGFQLSWTQSGFKNLWDFHFGLGCWGIKALLLPQQVCLLCTAVSLCLWWFLLLHQPKALQPGVPVFSACHFDTVLLRVLQSPSGYPCRTAVAHKSHNHKPAVHTPNTPVPPLTLTEQLGREEGSRDEDTPEPWLLQDCAHTQAT